MSGESDLKELKEEDEVIDLNKLREDDKKKPKRELTKEEIQLNIKQKELGKVMDRAVKKEMFLRKHKEMFNNDDSLLLYRLPLNLQQMQNMYENLTKS